MLSTATRILTFVVPVVWVSQTPDFEIRDVWFLSVMAVAIQAVISYLLLRREFGLRLTFPSEGCEGWGQSKARGLGSE